MLRLWKQASESVQEDTQITHMSPSTNNMTAGAEPPAKKRKTTPTLLSGINGLPRPVINSESIFSELEQGNGDYFNSYLVGFLSSFLSQ